MSLHNRILLLFFVLLLVVLGVTLVTVSQATYRHTLELAREDLAHAREILIDKLRSRQASLRESASTLAKDDALRQTIFVDFEDRESVRLALDNHRQRTSADLSMLIELDGNIMVDTMLSAWQGSPFPYPELLSLDAAQASAIEVIELGGQLYQVVTVPYFVPVSAPSPSLWLFLGRLIDDDFAAEVRGLTGTEMAIITPNADRFQVPATTLPAEPTAALTQGLGAASQSVDVVTLAEDRYLATTVPLSQIGEWTADGVLLRRTEDALLDYRELSTRFLFIAVISALLAIAGALVVARGITRPLRSLAVAARRIAAGDYSAQLPVSEAGEVGRLAREVGAMQQEVQEREAAIQHLAYHDDLTALPNRNQFRIDLLGLIEEAKHGDGRLAVAMVDLDRFKEINDTLGHHVGDRLLSGIAAQLQAVAEEMQVKVARLGGDEFGMLLPVRSVAEAREQMERLRSVLGGSTEIDDLRINLEASAGISIYPDQGGDAEILLQQAEIAMYVAKEKRLGVTFYESSQDRHSIQRLSLMSDLHKAVESGGLDLRFQPKLDLQHGSVDQAEVLVRWNHPTLGDVSPGEFIPIAEQTGFIRDITAWVMHEALEQVGRWLQKGLEVSAAVNVSAFDLHDKTLPGRLERLFDATRVSPENLVLEITESSVMTDLETGQRILDQLAAMGITISIDDFGTGYSSLSQLQKLPVQELKIDRSFIGQIERQPEAAQIVRSTIELGHNLGLRVVAEGVETQEALDLLRRMDCDLAQGYFISQPLTAEELEDWRSRVRSAQATG